MTAFSSLKDEDIMNLLAYIQAETEKGPEVAKAPVHQRMVRHQKKRDCLQPI